MELSPSISFTGSRREMPLGQTDTFIKGIKVMPSFRLRIVLWGWTVMSLIDSFPTCSIAVIGIRLRQYEALTVGGIDVPAFGLMIESGVSLPEILSLWRYHFCRRAASKTSCCRSHLCLPLVLPAKQRMIGGPTTPHNLRNIVGINCTHRCQ